MHLNEIFVYFHKIFFLGLPNLGTQIRCAQNWYTAVQGDLTYPLSMYQINVPRVAQKQIKLISANIYQQLGLGA